MNKLIFTAIYLGFSFYLTAGIDTLKLYSTINKQFNCDEIEIQALSVEDLDSSTSINLYGEIGKSMGKVDLRIQAYKVDFNLQCVIIDQNYFIPTDDFTLLAAIVQNKGIQLDTLQVVEAIKLNVKKIKKVKFTKTYHDKNADVSLRYSGEFLDREFKGKKSFELVFQKNMKSCNLTKVMYPWSKQCGNKVEYINLNEVDINYFLRLSPKLYNWILLEHIDSFSGNKILKGRRIFFDIKGKYLIDDIIMTNPTLFTD